MGAGEGCKVITDEDDSGFWPFTSCGFYVALWLLREQLTDELVHTLARVEVFF